MRPRPPAQLLETGLSLSIGFEPAHDLRDWMLQTFVSGSSELYNEDHMHLAAAQIGILWTNAPNSRNGRRVLAQAEFKPPAGTMGRWQRARAQTQIQQWFGILPDFLLTFDAEYAASCTDRQFCALVEHELYHCGQASDEFGGPKFSESSGMPVFCMRGHDIEEFTGVVRRYGTVTRDVAELVDAAAFGPEVDEAPIAASCGTCRG